MKNLKNWVVMLVLLGAMSSVHEGYGQSAQPTPNSAESSRSLGIRVSSPTVREGAESGSEIATRIRTSETPNANPVNYRSHSLPGALTHVRATDTTADLISACNAAVEELKASRRLIELLDRENALLKDRLEIEKRSTAMLTELNETRKAESEALRNVVAAKNETIIAKDAVIVNQDKLIETLKTKKSSPWKRIGDVLIGLAAGMVLR